MSLFSCRGEWDDEKQNREIEADVQRRITAAVFAERERCGRIADNYAGGAQMALHDSDFKQGWIRAAWCIGAEIRSDR